MQPLKCHVSPRGGDFRRNHVMYVQLSLLFFFFHLIGCQTVACGTPQMCGDAQGGGRVTDCEATE